jgi:hypothetical protein
MGDDEVLLGYQLGQPFGPADERTSSYSVTGKATNLITMGDHYSLEHEYHGAGPS